MRRVIVILLGMLALAGCGDDGATTVGAGSDLVSTPPSSPPPTSSGGSTGPVDPARTTTFQVWFARGETMWPVTRSVPKTDAVGAAAMTALLAGPSDTEGRNAVTSAVPEDTAVLGLAIDRGTATVDLSSAFQSGGGALSMNMRLGQVVYTLTQFPTVKRVVFQLDGRTVDVISGEGIVLDGPQTRADYESLLPFIAVASPGYSSEVASPATVTGLANVFEANVTVELLDASGRVIAKDFTTATCGTGCWGTYRLELPFTVESKQQGTVVVHDDDAEGSGTPPHEERIPVILLPG